MIATQQHIKLTTYSSQRDINQLNEMLNDVIDINKDLEARVLGDVFMLYVYYILYCVV